MKMKLTVIKGCFALSAALCIYYLATTHFEFMISLFHYMKFNLSSISYTLLRFFQILLPIFAFVPEKFTDKSRVLQIVLYAIGILYITGSSWIVYCLAANPVSSLGNVEFMRQYLQLNALNFGYLVWDSYDVFAVLFSVIEAALYIACAYSISRVRRRTVVLYVTLTVLSLSLPFLYVYLILGTGEFSTMFLQKNTVLIVSQILMCVGFAVAGTSRRLWETAIWE